LKDLVGNDSLYY